MKKSVGRSINVLTLLAILLAQGFWIPAPVSAANLTVNSTVDAVDSNPGDGVCETATPGECTLRAAIQEANSSPNVGGQDVINFNIPGAGVHTITPGTDLPAITDPVVIDGYTQPGASVNTSTVGSNATLLIELDGTNTVFRGLTIATSDSTVRGLVINRFTGNGIAIGDTAAPSNNIITGNFIGTDPTGLVARPNGSGQLYAGLILGNSAANNIIGGAALADRNIISGNNGDGIALWDFVTGTVTQGNLIGVGANGATALGNSFGGSGGAVSVRNYASDNTIGGVGSGEGNVIAYNAPVGFVAYSGTGNSVRGNTIYANAGMGIDLNQDGPDTNDVGDADIGSNNLQNYPDLASAVIGVGDLAVSYTLDSLVGNSAYPVQIDFYEADNPVDSEGRIYLGSTVLAASGAATANLGDPATLGISSGDPIVATATDAGGNTSEFSPAVLAYGSETFTVNSTADASDVSPGSGACETATPGQCTLRAAIEEANALPGAQTINLPAGTINLTGALPTLTGDLTVNGSSAAATTVRRDTGGDYRFFEVPLGVSLSVSGLTMENGRTPGFSSGGAIMNSGALTVAEVAFLNNFATADGGAIVNNNASSTLNINNATFSGNHANYDGGGIRINNGAVVIENSTFTQNSTGFSGAALRLISGTVLVTNSTLSGNNANFNGGAFEGSTANASFIHTTITGNSAEGTGGGLYGGTIQNSIVSGNTATSGPDIRGAITSLGYNLVGDPTDASGFQASDQLNANPLLEALNDNAGPTETHALQLSSPAIDAIPNGVNGCGATFTTDQRGAGRPHGLACDIGAFEYSTVTIDFDGLPSQIEGAAINTLNSTYASQGVSFDFYIPTYALPGWGYPIIGTGYLDVATHPGGADALVNFAMPVDSVSVNFLYTGGYPSYLTAYDQTNTAADNTFDGNVVVSNTNPSGVGVLTVSGNCIRSLQLEATGFNFHIDDLTFTPMVGSDSDSDGIVDQCDNSLRESSVTLIPNTPVVESATSATDV